MHSLDSDAKHFVMCLSATGRYVGLMTVSDIAAWVAAGDSKSASALLLMYPKSYIERVNPENQKQLQILMVPIHAAATPQELLFMRSDSIFMMEDLGELDEATNTCAKSADFYMQYRDAVATWAAQRANVVAPTARDIGRVTGGKGFNGPIKLS